MVKNVRVEMAERSYEITIAEQQLPGLGSACRNLGLGKSCMLVSDSNVAPLYAEKCRGVLEQAGFRVDQVVVPAGESSKAAPCLFQLYDEMARIGLLRSSFLVALGGGVVGDLAGFAAATYMRGIRFVQVPTSLLAMVDSSVGGKTGINLTAGKNLVGAFHQPVLVQVDLSTLNTLPDREYRSGLAEVVKYGIIQDAAFFDFLEANAAGILARDNRLLAELVARCCQLKAEVVRQDEREGGLRAILNFGHTFAHALEKTCGYGHWLHGEAVSIGMVYAAYLSEKARGLLTLDTQRIVNLLRALQLPVDIPEQAWLPLRDAMKKDKKNMSETPRFVLAAQMGCVERNCEVSELLLTDAFQRILEH